MPDSGSVDRSALGVRLVAEFVVIVLGVLVALAVDAALGARSERNQERTYYRSLANELVLDTAEYAIAIRMTARSIEAAHHVRSAILGDPIPSDRPLSQSVEYASWVNYPSWSSGTLDELYAAGTIRLIRDREIKEAIHAYRSEVNEWRPRMQGPEYGGFLAYRRAVSGLIPLEARIAYETTSLGSEEVEGLRIDEAAIATRLRGDEALLRDTETMIVEWTHLVVLYEEQRRLGLRLLNLLSERATPCEPRGDRC